MSTFTPASPAFDRNVLLGALAVQTALVSRDDLLGILTDWRQSPERALGYILVERGLLSEDGRGLLEGLVQELLDHHGGDLAHCLTAVGAQALLHEPVQTVHDPRSESSCRSFATAGSRSPSWASTRARSCTATPTPAPSSACLKRRLCGSWSPAHRRARFRRR